MHPLSYLLPFEITSKEKLLRYKLESLNDPFISYSILESLQYTSGISNYSTVNSITSFDSWLEIKIIDIKIAYLRYDCFIEYKKLI